MAKDSKDGKETCVLHKNKTMLLVFLQESSSFFFNLNQHLLGISPSRCDHRH